MQLCFPAGLESFGWTGSLGLNKKQDLHEAPTKCFPLPQELENPADRPVWHGKGSTSVRRAHKDDKIKSCEMGGRCKKYWLWDLGKWEKRERVDCWNEGEKEKERKQKNGWQRNKVQREREQLSRGDFSKIRRKEVSSWRNRTTGNSPHQKQHPVRQTVRTRQTDTYVQRKLRCQDRIIAVRERQALDWRRVWIKGKKFYIYSNGGPFSSLYAHLFQT